MLMSIGFLVVFLASTVYSGSEVNVDIIDASEILKAAEKLFGASSSYVFKPSDITFRLYNEGNNGTLMRVNGYDSKKLQKCKTIVLIHGWSENYQTPFNTLITEAYLKKGCYNVIRVDWSPIAIAVYRISSGLVDEMGDVIRDFILNNKIPLVSTRVIGFSLGAQVAGFVGKSVYKKVHCKIAEIVGLDPAGPNFYVNCNKRLCVSDADLVVIIHTDAGVFGIAICIGDLDIFVNGGTGLQPGCPCIGDFKKITNPADFVTTVACSHITSYQYYADIVCSRNMTCTLCNSALKSNIGLCKGNGKYIFMAEKITSEMNGKCYAKFT